MPDARPPRAVGRRRAFGTLPPAVHDWVRARFGPVTVTREHVGGMSPGCATSLTTADGRPLFVKAVSADVNGRTAELFRDEAALLSRLPAAAYRPSLLDSYRDDGWVALVMEGVVGRYPDLGDDVDYLAVRDIVLAQSAELTPPPTAAVRSMAASVSTWQQRWQQIAIDPHRYLPADLAARADVLTVRVRDLPAQLGTTTLCHADIRDDNLLITESGDAVIVDWGMAKLGPGWLDAMMLAVQRPDPADAAHWLDHDVPPEQRVVADTFLLAFAGAQSWAAQHRSDPTLPSMSAFQTEDSRRLFAVLRDRLG